MNDQDAMIRSEPRSVASPRRPRRRGVNRPQPSGFLSLRDLLFVLFKHKVKAVAVGVVIAALALAAAVLLPSRFESTAKMQVNAGRQSVGLDATSVIGPTMVQMVSRSAEIINSETQILRSRAVAEQAIKLLDQDPKSDRPEPRTGTDLTEAADRLTRQVEVKSAPDSTTLIVSYESGDPETSRRVVDAYVNAYLNVRAEMLRTRGSTGFFDQQSREARERLARIELQLRELKDQTGVADPDAQRQILLNRIAGLQDSIDNANADLSGSMKVIETLEARLAETPERTQLSSSRGEAMTSMDQLRSDVNKMRLDLADLRTRFFDTSPNVVMLQEKLKQAEEQLAGVEERGGSEVTGLNPVHQDLKTRKENEYATRDSLDARLQQLVADRRKAETGLASLNDADLKIRQLAREANIAEDIMKKYAQGLDVARTDEALGTDRISNISVYEPATFNSNPSSPNRKLLVLFGLFLAGCGAIGTAFVSEAFDLRVSRPEDLRHLGLNPIVPIPVIRMTRGLTGEPRSGEPVEKNSPPTAGDAILADAIRPTRFVRSTSRPNVTILPQRVAIGAEQVGAAASGSSASNDVLSVRGNIGSTAPIELGRPMLVPRVLDAAHAVLERLVYSRVAAGKMEMPRSIAVFSVTAGEGATTIATHLAAALTEYLPATPSEDRVNRVLLLDAHVAAPGVHRLLDVAATPGVAEWISEPGLSARPVTDMIRPTTVPNLDLIPAGLALAGHQPGRWTDAVVGATSSRHQAIVVDLPSMEHAEATARMAAVCDAAILVIECNAANREVVRQAVLRLEEAGVNLLGTILNKRSYPIPDSLYRWF